MRKLPDTINLKKYAHKQSQLKLDEFNSMAKLTKLDKQKLSQSQAHWQLL